MTREEELGVDSVNNNTNNNNNNNINLDKIRQKIELMNKENHIEIAKLLKEKNIKLTENNNGIFINLTNLSEETIFLLLKYIKHIENQENILNIIENKKEELENKFFKGNKE